LGIRVQKFGGSSIANITMINNVARRIVKAKEEGDQVVVVLSAMGDTTDELLEKVQGITSHPPEREIDMLLSTGEQVSIALMAMAITELGYPAVSMTGYQAGIQTDNAYTRARILNIEPERISGELEQDKIVIVAGFQ
jgi:aspartate kinase